MDKVPVNTPIQILVVGVGLVGKRHIQAIEKTNGVCTAGVVDPSVAGEKYAQENGFLWFQDLKQALEKCQNIDGVILATPNALHIEQALISTAHKIPTLVEKPLGTTVHEAQTLVNEVEKSGIPVLVGHHRRYNPLIQKAYDVIQEGVLGNIRAVNANCWFYKPDDYFEEAPWRKESQAGPVPVNLVHDIDLLRYLCGEVISIQAQAVKSKRGFETNDVAAALLKLENDAVVTVSVSDSVSAPWSWELTSGEYPVYPKTSQSCYFIGGEKASLSIPDLTIWHHEEKPDWWSPINAKSIMRDASDPLINQIEHFKQVIRGEKEPLVSAKEGLKTMKVIEGIQHAAQLEKIIHP